MVTLTQRAQDRLTSHAPAAAGMAWVIHIRWDRGDVEKVSDSTGEVTWKREPPRGWCVDLFGDALESLAMQPQLERPAPGIFVQPWLLPNPTFPSGEIDVEGDQLIFRAHAA
jgi:hypothetical protein